MAFYPPQGMGMPGMPPGQPMQGQTITNPPLPFTGHIGHSLQDGEMVIIQGYVPPHPQRFAVNLQSGQQEGSDIGLHFNPRFAGINEVVRNSYRGNWEHEEKGGTFPFQEGQSFEMIFLVQPYEFKIAVNGKHFAEFKHRLPKERINTLNVSGDVTIQSIRYQPPANQFPPAPPPAYMPPAPGFGGPAFGTGPIQSPPSYNLQVPYKTSIPGGLRHGQMIYISGIPQFGADRFDINILQHDNIALHFNPRINEGVVVRNSLIGGSWGPEERQQLNFPFKPNVNFDIMILVEGDKYKIAVNNQHFTEFRHRITHLPSVDQLSIDGGVKLTNVRIN